MVVINTLLYINAAVGFLLSVGLLYDGAYEYAALFAVTALFSYLVARL